MKAPHTDVPYPDQSPQLHQLKFSPSPSNQARPEKYKTEKKLTSSKPQRPSSQHPPQHTASQPSTPQSSPTPQHSR